MSEQPKHTPYPWEQDRQSGWISTVGTNAHGGGKSMHVADVRGWGHLAGVNACHMAPQQAVEIQEANGDLLALAPTAPHACVPSCPGEVNRAGLALLAQLAPALATPWLIWSNEHAAWWGPNRGGYFARAAVHLAGRYSTADALLICEHDCPRANSPKPPKGRPRNPSELMVPSLEFLAALEAIR